MKITSKSDYAMIIMIELAKSPNGELISLGKIAEKFNLSLSYIEQLASSLRRAKLITSKQGVKGGYALAKSTSQISSRDIIKAVGDEVQTVTCNGDRESCSKFEFCNAKQSWKYLNKKVAEVFNKVSLKELVNG